ncbi:hypothetical protein [Paraburkholderia sp.]|uniref:hypothetical protein n=1 Tax=Paraburkholderia sp. TaxID=1926495 RepID=UPI0023968657|nr:hypothetical protein [Paraburkholderia sp.]MDE1180445.1 hypothetical protein [Paraburkholderia sp.]
MASVAHADILTGAAAVAHKVTHAVSEATGTEAPESIPSLATKPMKGDDPVAIRDALATQAPVADKPSLTDRVRKLIRVPTHAAQHDPDLAKAGLDHEIAFVVQAPYGILYRPKARSLSVNVDLSGDGTPGLILLKKTITGPRGRGLVVAPEAKAKGYIQHIDVIQLDSGQVNKAQIQGRVPLTHTAFDEANGDFAVVLVGRLAPPYLTDSVEHTDPTNDEPTDITTRTSTLHVDVQAVWLVSPAKGIVLSRKLRLSK